MTPQATLGRFLRNLRQSWDDVSVTQKQLADALGLSSALLSSWESGAAVPPEERIRQYARFFCSHRSVEMTPAALIPSDDLTPDEEREREDLIEKLVRLREDALHRPVAARRDTGALGGRFWYFSDGQPITIFCTPFSRRQLLGAGHEDDPIDASLTPVQQYALNPTHPNAIRNLNNGDIDALIELVGHIRAENPAIDISWSTVDSFNSADDFTGHIVVLGGADVVLDDEARAGEVFRELKTSLGLPLDIQDARQDKDEFDLQFVIHENAEGTPDRLGAHAEPFGPRFRRDESKPGRPRVLLNSAPVLEYDVALIARRPNPLNASATITLCSGLFSRGTYGAVRAFTDASLRVRNEQYLGDIVDPGDFWMLIQVPIIGGRRTITPDLGRPVHRLRWSPKSGAE